MVIHSEPLPGTYLLQPKVFADGRGDFVKTYHDGIFCELGMPFRPVEEFFSTSRRGVLRGMHFQLPPHQHDKLVYCIRGRVLDVLLDLRAASPACGRHAVAELSRDNSLVAFIPGGVAHGFIALEDDSVLVYKTSAVHAPAHDAGVRWDSFGCDWGGYAPTLVSDRDRALPALADFKNPF